MWRTSDTHSTRVDCLPNRTLPRVATRVDFMPNRTLPLRRYFTYTGRRSITPCALFYSMVFPGPVCLLCGHALYSIPWCFRDLYYSIPWCFRDLYYSIPWCFRDLYYYIPWCFRDLYVCFVANKEIITINVILAFIILAWGVKTPQM